MGSMSKPREDLLATKFPAVVAALEALGFSDVKVMSGDLGMQILVRARSPADVQALWVGPRIEIEHRFSSDEPAPFGESDAARKARAERFRR